MIKKSVYDNINKAVEASQKTTMAPVKSLLLGLIKVVNNIDEAIKNGAVSPSIYSFGDLSRINGKISSYIDTALVSNQVEATLAQIIENSLALAQSEVAVELATNLEFSKHNHLL